MEFDENAFDIQGTKNHQQTPKGSKKQLGLYFCLNIVILFENKIFAANIGAHRLFFLERPYHSKLLQVKHITSIHTKENIKEQFRVKREQSEEPDNNKLGTLQDIDEQRFIFPEYDLTRALGAFKLSGIISTPDVVVMEIPKFQYVGLFFGSMGLWKVLKTQQIANEIQQSLQNQDLCKGLNRVKNLHLRKSEKMASLLSSETEKSDFLSQADYSAYLILI